VSCHSFVIGAPRGAPNTEANLHSSVTSTDDGDISSTTGTTARNAASQPHNYRAPVLPTTTSVPTAQGSTDSSPPSPQLVPSRFDPSHGAQEQPTNWAAAPQGFLSNMSAEDIQVGLLSLVEGQLETRRLTSGIEYRSTSLRPLREIRDAPTRSTLLHKVVPFASTLMECTIFFTVRCPLPPSPPLSSR
jgi:hypothetical protein